ncbi:hypothetical protein C8J30_11722 [Rhodobacter viridis]|uniref:DUF4123 domain-containing protein n=1 Tax=Rhodobacter viridis TaxID=1054202 RepID=A0A318TRK8_9RHOB|nr:hypothetical protein [Rhodobacter viridis]PYF07471.1 hypothetical protein C8J30_11722 [Rhodobacter viridis]
MGDPLQDIVLQEANGATPVLAVQDGAQFDDLPRALLLGGFDAPALYLDRGDNDPARLITAPQLVWLDERPVRGNGRPPEATLPALLALIENRPAAVFWRCAAGGDALFRHLRGLNMVMIPKTAARLFGPAEAIVFCPDPDWLPEGTKAPLRYARRPDWPLAQPGMARLSPETLARMQALREARTSRRVAAYLCRVAPDQTAARDDTRLAAATAHHITEARGLGVRSEAALGRRCFLQLLCGGSLGASPGGTATNTRPPSSPRAVRALRCG